MFNQLQLKARRSFTLVELIIVIVIVGILAAISIVGYQSVVDRVDQAAAETTLQSVDREYRALAAFNMAADSTAGVPIADMTAIDGIDYTAGDTDGDGLLEPGETVAFDGVVLTLSAATTAGSIDGTAGSGGSGGGGSGTSFSVSYSQQSFDASSSSQTLSPTTTGGDGSVTYSYTGSLPTGVSFDTSSGIFTGASAWNPVAASVATGLNHSCATLTDGSVQCWGGAPGLATVPNTVTNATAVAAGGYHNCALLSGGNVECWGNNNNFGQLTVPPSVQNATVTAIAAGENHTCAVLSGGTVECWGAGSDNQLMVPNDLANAVAVSAGAGHSCALIGTDDTVRCWGLYNGSPVPAIPSVTNPVAIASGANHTCVLLSGGTVECWGSNSSGQAPAVAPVSDAVAVSAGYSNSCALNSSGAVTCWGSNYFNESMGYSSVFGISAFNSGGWHGCALIVNGRVECWGNNNSSQAPPAVAGIGNFGFPAPIEVTATSGSETSVVTVNLTVS